MGDTLAGIMTVPTAPAAVTSEEIVLKGKRPAAGTLRLWIGVVDAAIVALAFLIATAIRIPDAVDLGLLPKQLSIVCTLMLAGLALQRAYELQQVHNGEDVLTRIALGVLLGLGLVILASYVAPQVSVGRGVFALHAALAAPLLLAWRRYLIRTMREEALRPRAVVLGEPAVARKVGDALASARFGGTEVVGVLCPEGDRTSEWAALKAARDAGQPAPGDDLTFLGGYDRLGEVVLRHGVEQVVVVKGPADASLPIQQVLEIQRAGVLVLDGATAYESVTGKILIEKLTPGWLVFANALEKGRLERAVRRALDVAVAGLGLVLLAPVFAASALAVRLTSPGPILFRQRRAGLGGRPFDILKFRTMVADAEAKTGAVWAVARDPRVTGVGRFLRRSRLDEIPQLWNVLRGDMSLVGPRPERPEFTEMLRSRVQHFDLRHSVRPGVTGWAQINYRYGASVDDAREKLHYDLFYVQNMSVLLDLEVILGTIRVVLGMENQN